MHSPDGRGKNKKEDNKGDYIPQGFVNQTRFGQSVVRSNADQPRVRGIERETYIVQATVSTDRTSLVQVSHFTNNSGNTTSAQASSSSTDEFRQGTEELTFRERGFYSEKVCEDTDDHEKLICRVAEVSRLSGSLSGVRDLAEMLITHLSIRDKKAVSKEYGTSSLYVFCPRKRTPSSMSSQMTKRSISPR